MKVWEQGADFLSELKADPEVPLEAAALEACFDLGYHSKRVDEIFRRVFA